MSLDDLKTLDELLQDFVNEKEEELAASVTKASTTNLANKIYEQGQSNLKQLKFAKMWVRSAYLNTPGYKPNHPLF